MEGPQPDLPELVPRAGARRRVQRLPDAPLAVVQVLAQGIIELAGLVELETKVKRRFGKDSIVSYIRLSLMLIALASRFHVYLPWGQRLFSIVS